MSVLKKYKEKGLLQLKKKDDLVLTCYTKKAFYSREWDDVLTAARGHVYDEDMNVVSCPFDKIFNIGEVPETSLSLIKDRIANEPYTLWEKLNGHLCILFQHKGTFINTTKGSWDHEFIEKDRGILDKHAIPGLIQNPDLVRYTFLFEIISEYDQHMLYEEHVKRFGKNEAVLLGAIDNSTGLSVSPKELVAIGKKLSVPLPFIYPSMMATYLESLFEGKGIEGYVIQFHNDDYRVKVKTDWYVQNHFKRSMVSSNRIKKIFYECYDSESAFESIPEEYHLNYRNILSDYHSFAKEKHEDCERAFSIIGEGCGYVDRPIIDTIERSFEGHEKAVMWYIRSNRDPERIYKKWFLETYDFDNIKIDRGE